MEPPEFRLTFEMGTPIDYVVQELRERLQPLRAQFPEDTRTPQITKYDPSSSPVMVISLFGSLDLVSLRLAGEDLIQKNLARVPGVVHTEVIGGQQLEVVIEPDLEGLRAVGLSVLKLTEALKQANLDVAAGFLSQRNLRLPLRSLGEFRHLHDIGRLGVIRTPSGSVVYSGSACQGELRFPGNGSHQPLPGGTPGDGHRQAGTRQSHRRGHRGPAPGPGEPPEKPAIRSADRGDLRPGRISS